MSDDTEPEEQSTEQDADQESATEDETPEEPDSNAEAAAAKAAAKKAAAEKAAEDARREREAAAYCTNFGKHALSLRKARGLTQEQLAKRSGLAADTIRRLEHGDFSPGLGTLHKLAGGLRLPLSTMFLALESGQQIDSDIPELLRLLSQVPHVPIRAIIALVEALAEGLDEDD